VETRKSEEERKRGREEERKRGREEERKRGRAQELDCPAKPMPWRSFDTSRQKKGLTLA
jgi:hypothetical protein